MWTDERLKQPDDKLALDLLSELILFTADQNGIAVSDVTEPMAKAMLLKAGAADGDSIKNAALEKVFRRAIAGDLAGAGHLFRELMVQGAVRLMLDRWAEVGARRKRQVSGFAKKGNKARRKYSDDDKIRWRELAASSQLAHIDGKKRKASLIARREGLPAAAVETIRKAI